MLYCTQSHSNGPSLHRNTKDSKKNTNKNNLWPVQVHVVGGTDHGNPPALIFPGYTVIKGVGVGQSYLPPGLSWGWGWFGYNTSVCSNRACLAVIFLGYRVLYYAHLRFVYISKVRPERRTMRAKAICACCLLIIKRRHQPVITRQANDVPDIGLKTHRKCNSLHTDITQ